MTFDGLDPLFPLLFIIGPEEVVAGKFACETDSPEFRTCAQRERENPQEMKGSPTYSRKQICPGANCILLTSVDILKASIHFAYCSSDLHRILILNNIDHKQVSMFQSAHLVFYHSRLSAATVNSLCPLSRQAVPAQRCTFLGGDGKVMKTCCLLHC